MKTKVIFEWNRTGNVIIFELFMIKTMAYNDKAIFVKCTMGEHCRQL